MSKALRRRHKLTPRADYGYETLSAPTPKETKKNRRFNALYERWTGLHHKLGSSPLIMFILGGLSLLLWVAATVVQIQTSEYLAMGNPDRVASVAWGILMQPWLMVTGQAPIKYVTAWMYGWSVELVTLIFAMALSVAVAKIATVNPRLAKWFVIGGAGLILLNGWADYSSSPGTSILVQLLIALAIGGVVVVGLPLGIGLIEYGIEEL